MKKLIVILTLVMVACAPVMAGVTISCVQVGGCSNEVEVRYAVSGPNKVRAFGINVALSGGATITSATCSSADYDIYPGSVTIEGGTITASGTCVCSTMYPGTEGGIGTSSMTVEMGSLYASGESKPGTSGVLFKFTMSSSNNIGVTLSENTARGIFMENPDESPGLTLAGCTLVSAAPPSAPASITYPTYDAGDGFTVSWAASSGATSYQLERNLNGAPYEPVYDGTNTSWAQGPLPDGSSYMYCVKATNECGSSAWRCGVRTCWVNSVDCLPSSKTGFNDWKTMGKPMCWCGTAGTPAWPFQCYGDADNKTQTVGKGYRVYTNDYWKLKSNWMLRASDVAVGKLDPCADFDHKSQTLGKSYRIYTNDYWMMKSHWCWTDSRWIGGGKCPTN